MQIRTERDARNGYTRKGSKRTQGQNEAKGIREEGICETEWICDANAGTFRLGSIPAVGTILGMCPFWSVGPSPGSEDPREVALLPIYASSPPLFFVRSNPLNLSGEIQD